MIEMINKVEILNDNGFVEEWDFSKANMSYESRVNAVTTVASICYQNPKALGSVSLFNRLKAESAGLPSSSYEFVPVLLDEDRDCSDDSDVTDIFNKACGEYIHDYEDLKIIKYGEKIVVDDKTYLLTNLRALIEDIGEEESLKYFNTDPEEIQIIKDNYKVFQYKVDLPTRAQMVRHRINWQELSRRYVSGKRKAFDFYVSNKMKDIDFVAKVNVNTEGNNEVEANLEVDMNLLIDLSLQMYDACISSGIKPEDARRSLPQGMMTQIWGGFQPNQLDGFYKLRLDSHAQKEIREVAEAMKTLEGN